MIKYKVSTKDLLDQVYENTLKISIREEDPKADNRDVQLTKQIAQIKARIASLQQSLDTLQDRKQG